MSNVHSMSRKTLIAATMVAATLWSLAAALILPQAASAAACTSGSLVKGPSYSAVYYCGADGKRYVFPNEKTYFSWYPDFSQVIHITDAELASLQIGGNVTSRPGVKMLKIQSDPRTYAVSHDGTLRHVTSEAVAICLYGVTWNFTSVNDLSDAFFTNYTVGAPINNCSEYNKSAEMASSQTINQDMNLPSSGDTTAPSVSSTSPSNGASGVALNAKVQANFSEMMDPATVNSATFTLRAAGGAPVTGSVSYSGSTATFSPDANLFANTDYTAIITTGARDQSGNSLSSNYVWTFRTGSSLDTSNPSVVATDPSNGQSGVGLNKQITAAFSEPMDPSSINANTFYLRQGVNSVSGTVSYSGITATFSPSVNLLPNTTYTATVTTGAKDLAGNGMSSNYVWSFTTGNSLDTTNPIIISTDPSNGATGVPVTKVVSATFSEAMDSSSVNNATFTLKLGNAPVAGTVSYSGNTASFTPSTSLSQNTAYTATVTTGVRDLAGNHPASDYIWSFTTGTVPDSNPPIVSSTDPTNGQSNVALNHKVSASFSEAMEPATINNTTFMLKQNGTPVAGTVSYAGNTATFTPSLNLSPSLVYTATITTGAHDLAGNSLGSDFTWSFTTGTTPDTTAPTVTSTSPSNGETNVMLNKQITAMFSESMDSSTINNATFTLRRGVISISGTVTYSGVTATFSPLGNLLPNTTYTATISTGAKDLAGNSMTTDYVWAFTTGM